MRIRQSPFLILLSLMFVGLALRIYYAQDLMYKADAIIVALMTNDIATATFFPIIYYGQNYMGSIEGWIGTPLFMITGPTWPGISFAPILVSTVGIIPFYLLGLSLGGKRTGYIAASFWAITPAVVTFYNVSPRGCYPEVLCGGTLLVWFATQRWKGEVYGSQVYFAMGALAGILLWTSLIAMPYVLAMVLFVVLSDRKQILSKAGAAGLAGLVTGSIPLIAIAGNLHKSGIGSIKLDSLIDKIRILGQTTYSVYLPHADGAVSSTLLHAVGAAVFYLAVISLILFIITGFINIKGNRDEAQRNSFLPLIFFTLAFIGFYVTSRVSGFAEMRHTLPLQTSFIMATALAIQWVWSRWRYAGWALFSFIVIANGSINIWNHRIEVVSNKASLQDYRRLVSELNELGVKSVVIDQFDSLYRIIYESMTRGAPINGMQHMGHSKLQKSLSVERDANTALIARSGREAKDFAKWIERCCDPDPKKSVVSGWTIFHSLRIVKWSAVSIPPETWVTTERLRKLGDRNLRTHSTVNPFLTIELKEPSPITRIRVIYGKRFPGSTQILLSADGENWKDVGGEARPSLLFPAGSRVYVRSYWNRMREYEEWNFKPFKARYVRFVGDSSFEVQQLFIYRHGGASPPNTDLNKLKETLIQKKIKIVIANRWVAANLAGFKNVPFETIQPSIRSADERLEKSNWEMTPEVAAVVDKSDSAELEARLKRKGASFSTVRMGEYTLFTFSENAGEMWWTGFTLIDFRLEK